MRVMRQIKAIMKNEAIKQVDLAKKTGISPVTINRWMTGAKKPSIESVEKLVNAIGYKILVYNDAKPEKFCPDLVTREERKAIAIGTGDIVISYFEPCLQNKCVAYKDGKCLKYKETVLITEGEE